MDFEECEVSWIVQGNYEKFLKAFPNLKSLKIKGSAELSSLEENRAIIIWKL